MAGTYKKLYEKGLSEFLDKAITQKSEITKIAYKNTTFGYLYNYNPHINGFFYVFMEPGSWEEQYPNGPVEGYLLNESGSKEDGLFKKFRDNCGMLAYDIDIPQLSMEYETYSSRNRNLNYATKTNLMGDFSIKYLETSDMKCIRYQSSWIQYIDALKKGYLGPAPETSTDLGEFIPTPYYNSIWVIIFDKFGTNIRGIVKIMGVAPVNLPIKDVIGERGQNTLSMVTCNYKCHDMIYEFYETKDAALSSFLGTELSTKLSEGSLVDGGSMTKSIGNVTGNSLNTNITSANYNATMEIFNKLNDATIFGPLFNTNTNLNNVFNLDEATQSTLKDAYNNNNNNNTTNDTNTPNTPNDVTTYKQIDNITINDTNTNDYNNIKKAFEEAIKSVNSDIPDSAIDKLFDYYKNILTDTLSEQGYINKNNNILSDLFDNDGNSKLDGISQEEYNNIMQTTHDSIIDDNSIDGEYFKNNLDIESYKDLDNLFNDTPEVLGLIDYTNMDTFIDNPQLEYFDQENVPINGEDLNYVDYKLFKEQLKKLQEEQNINVDGIDQSFKDPFFDDLSTIDPDDLDFFGSGGSSDTPDLTDPAVRVDYYLKGIVAQAIEERLAQDDLRNTRITRSTMYIIKDDVINRVIEIIKSSNPSYRNIDVLINKSEIAIYISQYFNYMLSRNPYKDINDDYYNA